MLSGREAVALHWREQWRKADAKVYINSISWQDTKLVLSVALDINRRATVQAPPPKTTVQSEIDDAFDLRRQEAAAHAVPAYPILRDVLDRAEEEVRKRLRKLKLYP
jgi:hypothetical protein